MQIRHPVSVVLLLGVVVLVVWALKWRDDGPSPKPGPKPPVVVDDTDHTEMPKPGIEVIPEEPTPQERDKELPGGEVRPVPEALPPGTGDPDDDPLEPVPVPSPRPRPIETVLLADGTLAGHLTSRNYGEIVGDSDADGLTDAEEGLAKTDPQNPDTDGDGLLDGWELKGVDGTKLAALGANPLRKDVFVEMDWMERPGAPGALTPSANVLDTIRKSFASAPITNPDGSAGISLHLELNEEVPHAAEMSAITFYIYKGKHFKIGERGRCFHYMIWADAWEFLPGIGNPSGFSMGIPYSDFVVTLGPWHNQAGGDDAEKTGTFLHELGHNLGLRHGGDEDMNEKPNHLSIMNYRWQMTGLKKLDTSEWIWSYQSRKLPALDEKNLDEVDGLGISSGSAPTGYATAWYDLAGNAHEGAADSGVDWDGSGPGPLTSSVSVDLNRDGGMTVLNETRNEWETLIFKGGLIGSGLTPSGLRRRGLLVPTSLPEETMVESLSSRLRKELRFN